MPERVRLFLDAEQRAETDREVEPVADGPALGFLHLEIQTSEDDNHDRWRAKILGSDYLVWGMNHRRVVVEFASGERRRAVVRATGDLIGFGPGPTTVGP